MSEAKLLAKLAVYGNSYSWFAMSTLTLDLVVILTYDVLQTSAENGRRHIHIAKVIQKPNAAIPKNELVRRTDDMGDVGFSDSSC